MAAIPIITPFTNNSIDEVILSLQDSAKKVFQYNQTKRNTDECLAEITPYMGIKKWKLLLIMFSLITGHNMNAVRSLQ